MERQKGIPVFDKEAGYYLSETEKQRYIELVLKAKEARSYPHQSGYFVRTAGITKDGFVYLGGNKENSLSDAFIHGETAVLSGIRDKTDSPVEAIAWYRKEGEIVTPDQIVCPCGGCRDVLSGYCDRDLVLLSGNESGVVMHHLDNFLFDEFRPENLSLIHEEGVVSALEAACAGVSIYLPPEMRGGVYGAALVGEDGTIWKGVLNTNAGYDAITPVLSAVTHWRDSYPYGSVSERHLRLSRLVIAGGEEMVDPFYRDRQSVLELDEVLRKFTGSKTSLRVEIVRTGNEVKAEVTDVEEWLPHPFSPGAFRMDDVLEAQLAQLTGLK